MTSKLKIQQMIELPFDKWTLTFHNQDLEKGYEKEQNIMRLLILRVMAFCISLTAIICLIIFVVQGQNDFLLYEMAFVLAGCLCMLIVSHKLLPYLKYAFSFINLLCIVTSTLIIQNGQYVPNYVYGFSISLFMMTIIQNCSSHSKFMYIIVSPSFILGMFGVLEIHYLQYILFTVMGMIILVIYTHHAEYISKLAFSQGIIIQKQRDIISQCVKESLLFIKFNKMTNQFELQFQNQQCEEYFNISNTQQMKEFLRNYYIIEINMKESIRKFKNVKLEDYLFQMLKQNEDLKNEEWFENQIQNSQQPDYSSTEKIQIKQIKHSIKFKIITQGHPLIILLIEQKNNQTQTGPKGEQIMQFQHIIVTLVQSIAKSSQNLYSQIQLLQNKISNKDLKVIQFSTFAQINQINNILTYYQKEKLCRLQERFDSFFFYQFLESIEPYFNSRSQQFKRKFELNQRVMPGLSFKINYQIILQIILNFFEFSLKKSIFMSTINLQISLDEGIYAQEKGKISDSQQLLKFNLIFNSQQPVNFDKPGKDYEKDLLNQINNIDLQIDYPVSCLLLGIIGPFNHIIFHEIKNTDQNEYVNSIIFYIYADQSQLDPSFTKYINPSWQL